MRANLLGGLSRRWRTASYWVRELFGENDYPRYVAEWRSRHPEGASGPPNETETRGQHQMLTARELFEERLRIKYGADVQRCC